MTKNITRVKTKTKLTKEILKTFLEVYYFDKIKNIRIIINILIIIYILMFFKKDTKETIDLITFIFALFSIIELNTRMIPNINYKRILKSKNSVINTELTYEFKDYNLNITIDKTEYIEYSTIYKVIETNTYYYIYKNKSKAFIIDKKEMNEKEIEVLSTLLKTRINNYKEIK